MDITPEFIGGLLGVLLASSFIRFATVFTIFRFGLGLRGVTFGFITAALSLALATAVLEKDLGRGDISLLNPKSMQGLDVEKTFRPLLEHRTDPGLIKDLGDKILKKGQHAPDEKPSFGLLLSAYILSELKSAFEIGIMILIPFVVIDLLVSNILVMLGVTQLSAAAVSVPLKLLLFFVVNGWTLLAEKILGGIGG